MEEFRCEFRIGETKHEKPALRSGEDTVVCGEMRFDQAGGDGLLPVAFDVVWMSSEAPKAHVIDNTQKVAVEVSIYYEFFVLLLLLHYQNNSKIYIIKMVKKVGVKSLDPDMVKNNRYQDI